LTRRLLISLSFAILFKAETEFVNRGLGSPSLDA